MLLTVRYSPMKTSVGVQVSWKLNKEEIKQPRMVVENCSINHHHLLLSSVEKTSFQQCEPDMDGVTYRFHFFPRQRTIIGIFYQPLISLFPLA